MRRFETCETKQQNDINKFETQYDKNIVLPRSTRSIKCIAEFVKNQQVEIHWICLLIQADCTDCNLSLHRLIHLIFITLLINDI